MFSKNSKTHIVLIIQIKIIQENLKETLKLKGIQMENEQSTNGTKV